MHYEKNTHLPSNIIHLILLPRLISQPELIFKPIDAFKYSKYQIMKRIGHNLFTWLHRQKNHLLKNFVISRFPSNKLCKAERTYSLKWIISLF